jgi:hypothetical protein
LICSTGIWEAERVHRLGDISGNAATASTSSGVTFIMNAGTPEGNQQASPGVFYQDTDTNIIYVKSDGDDTIGWDAIT